MNISFHHHKLPVLRMKKGFALVVTLSLMILLTIIAVGLLSLSAISLRGSSQVMAQSEAKANARLALMLALGELQKEMGPDQRISARAEILDNTPDSVSADGVANPHYVGVWNSWDTWLTDKKGSLSIQDTYKRGRDPSLFRTWLVSHPESGQFQTAISAVPAPDMIELCGEGSAGLDRTNHVMVSRIPVFENNVRSGSYAWWVSDESQKARLDLKAREEDATLATAHAIASQTGRMGIEKMTGMSDYNTAPEVLEKMITTGQADLSSSGVSERFHDLTAYSMGLLTDVRFGGFKSDLNLAFESDEVPQEMDEAELFGDRPFEAPIRPMTGALEEISPQNPYIAPMGWRSLREYYRLYREFPGNGVYKPVQWDGDKPLTHRFIMGRKNDRNRWNVAGYGRLPVLLRQTWVLATLSEANPTSPDKIDYYICAVPIVSFWNPYNIPLEVESTEISTLGSLFFSVPLRQRIYLDGVLAPGGEGIFGNRKGAQIGVNMVGFEGAGGQPGYRMIPVERGMGTIRFEPGEVLVFSTDEGFTGKSLYNVPGERAHHFAATPGYTPIQAGPNVARGLKYKLFLNPNETKTPSLSLRLAASVDWNDCFYSGGSSDTVMGYSMQEAYGAKQGLYFEDGSNAGKESWEYHDVNRLAVVLLDWFRGNEVNDAWIVQDDPASRARWPAPGAPPLPIGIVSIVAKSPEKLAYASKGGFAADFRNRNWLHAPPTGLGGTFLMNPVDLNRADCAYQIHFTAVNGDQEVSQYLEADGPNGFYGGGYSRGTGQTNVTALGLPITPIQSLGGFAGSKIAPARAVVSQFYDSYSNPTMPKPSGIPEYMAGTSNSSRGYYQFKHGAVTGASFGAGVGNAYAHPMIAPEGVYTRNDFGVDPGWDGTNTVNFAICDDYWDHLFLANEELWDSWFCSGIAPVVNNGRIVTGKEAIAADFFANKPSRLSPHFQPDLRGKTSGELAGLVETTTAAPGKNGWDLIGSHILNRGQFNVNSTSKEAWKALLMSLVDRPIACYEPASGTSVLRGDQNEASLSRNPLANSKVEAQGPDDENAWRGIRKLNERQIDTLAEQIVRQVKLRGPFLNMTEFINRRLSDDDMGVTGALQAAIDWDEFNAGYSGGTSGSGESINKAYKGSGDMISKLPAAYPNEKAARGSLYAGIPGYVMQSDILQGISSSLSVRGDTFVIRSYGESLTPDGGIAARAWCEAVVQRKPEYVDPRDEAEIKLRTPGQAPGATPSPLALANQEFGRKFGIISFRWLNQDEI